MVGPPLGLEGSGLAAEGPTQASEEEGQGHRKIREVIISADALIDLGRLSRTPPFTIPARHAMRAGATWAEALEGCLAGDNDWGTLAAYRTRIILAPIPKGSDRIEELNDRLELWEHGRFDDLIGKIVGQQVQDGATSDPRAKWMRKG